MEMIQQQGAWGAVLLILLYALACITLLPGSLLTLGAGAVYGVALGSLLISLGSLLGSTISFLASRYLFREWIKKMVVEK